VYQMYLLLPSRANKIIRFASASLLATIVTLGLFYVMNMMVTSEISVTERSAATNIVNFIKLKTETQVQNKKRQKEITDPHTTMIPARPAINTLSDTVIKSPVGLKIPAPKFSNFSIKGSPVIGEIGPDSTDGTLIPVSRIAPQYPRKAAQKMLEGWVELEFTVAPDGSVIDIKVLNAKPDRVFNRAAIKAISQWKFKPVGTVVSSGKRYSQIIEFKLNHE